MPRARINPQILTRAGLLLVAGLSFACSDTEQDPAGPDPPDIALDVAYGPDSRNVLDFWRAGGIGPTPLAVFIHGGGFVGGSKDNILRARRDSLLSAGISVASINYRLATTNPMPAQQSDAARAVQFLRSRAEEWGLDAGRICAWGTSGGGALSMWLGTHDDVADPGSADPVARESSRLTCMAPIEAQSTFDREWMQTVLGGNLHMHPSFPLWFGVEDYAALESAAVLEVINEVSALEHVTQDDAPAYMVYYQPNVRLPDDANPRDGGHHPAFGVSLKDRMDAVGVEAVVVIQDRATGPDPYGSVVAFIRAKLGR